MFDNETIHILDPIEIWILQIGNFAAKIENDPGGLNTGTMAEGDCKILRLVVGSNFSWVFQENFKKAGGFFVVTFSAHLWHMCDDSVTVLNR